MYVESVSQDGAAGNGCPDSAQNIGTVGGIQVKSSVCDATALSRFVALNSGALPLGIGINAVVTIWNVRILTPRKSNWLTAGAVLLFVFVKKERALMMPYQ